MPESRLIDTLLAAYRASHRDPTNAVIHLVSVPAIVFAVLGLMWTIHPLLAAALGLAALRYYFKLSRGFARGMLLMLAAMLILLLALPAATVLPLSLTILVLAWTGQFVGHLIEGRRPPFPDNLRSFLIGPLFVLSFLYRRYRLDY